MRPFPARICHPKAGHLAFSNRLWLRPTNLPRRLEEIAIKRVVFSSDSGGEFNRTRIWRTLMGREAICECTFNGTTAKVKALLETHELILRGDIHLRAPLDSLHHVRVE